MGRPKTSPLSLSARAAQLLLLLGAPLTLPLGCSVCEDQADPMHDLCDIYPYIDFQIDSVEAELALSWFETNLLMHKELSLHCVDYVVETSSISQSRRVINSVAYGCRRFRFHTPDCQDLVNADLFSGEGAINRAFGGHLSISFRSVPGIGQGWCMFRNLAVPMLAEILKIEIFSCG